jgi:predicted nucleic acid-binding protein
MAIVLDAGALIAIERHDRKTIGLLAAAQWRNDPLVTSSAAVAQVLRHPGLQAGLVRVLRGVDERPLDPDLARHIGRLLARTATSDVVAAAIALAARPGDQILTSDPEDLVALTEGRSITIRVV